MDNPRPWRLALALILTASAGACATHSDHHERGRISETGSEMGSAAVTPLRDVGLIRPQVPDSLENLGYPYKTDTLAAGCPAIAYEIAQLDAVIGPENYQPGHETSILDRSLDSAGDYAQGYAVGAVRDAVNVVPFRSWVRRLSGAANAEKKASRALELGHTRRTFLRGYGAALGCPDVVPAPPPPRQEHERRHGEHEEQSPPPAQPIATAPTQASPQPTLNTQPIADTTAAAAH